MVNSTSWLVRVGVDVFEGANSVGWSLRSVKGAVVIGDVNDGLLLSDFWGFNVTKVICSATMIA